MQILNLDTSSESGRGHRSTSRKYPCLLGNLGGTSLYTLWFGTSSTCSNYDLGSWHMLTGDSYVGLTRSVRAC
jgi:hypothetical protein